MNDFRRWMVAGAASDFNLVTINRRHVILARRIKHGPQGIEVTLVGQSGPIALATSFDEFEAWLAGANR